MGTVAAVVLAAGAGSRFTASGHKLLADLGGRPVVAHALAAADAAGLDELVVVTGAIDLVALLPSSAIEVHNPSWADGQATSLAYALDHARARGHEAVVVGLGDQPFVEPEAWRRVAATDSPIAVATYDGRRANPVRLAAAVWDDVDRTGDAGARALIARRPELVRGVPCPGHPADIDTAEDLARWSS